MTLRVQLLLLQVLIVLVVTVGTGVGGAIVAVNLANDLAGWQRALGRKADATTLEACTAALAERDQLIKGFLTPRMRELGVYTRFDDRAETCALRRVFGEYRAPTGVAAVSAMDRRRAYLRGVIGYEL